MGNSRDEHLREVSRTAYGQAHRLGIMLALDAAPEAMCLQDLSVALGVPASSLQAPLDSLRSLGLVEAVAQEGTRRVALRVMDGPGWEWARQLGGATRPGRGLTLP